MLFENFHFNPDALGRVDQVSIGALDAAVTVIRQSGDDAAGSAISDLAELIATDPELGIPQRDQLVELLNIIAAELTVPMQQRRRAGAISILRKIGLALKPHSRLAQSWARHAPALIASFA